MIKITEVKPALVMIIEIDEVMYNAVFFDFGDGPILTVSKPISSNETLPPGLNLEEILECFLGYLESRAVVMQLANSFRSDEKKPTSH